MRRILFDALPAHPARVLVVGSELDELQTDLDRVVGTEAELIRVDLDLGPTPAALRLDQPDRSVSAVVLHRCLRHLSTGRLTVLLGECHRVLGDGGRVVVRDRLLPLSRWTQWIGPSVRRSMGVPHTSADIFAIMERVGFWDCLVLRGQPWRTEVVIKGDKVVQQDLVSGELEARTAEDAVAPPAFKIVR